MPKGKWDPLSAQQIEKIKTEYHSTPVKRLAKELGISFGRVMNFLNKNKLTIPKEVIEQRKKESQRKKGDVSWNKGRKQTDYMSAEAIERTKSTRFKKGNLPCKTIGRNNCFKTGQVGKSLQVHPYWFR